MTKAVLFVDKPYLGNRVFDKNSSLNRDNCLSFYHELQSMFAGSNISLTTQDITDVKDAEVIIFSDIPKDISIIKAFPKGTVKVCILFESEIIKPWNWDLANHDLFNLIFTWNDGYVDNEKYFKINFSCDLENLKTAKATIEKKYDLVMFSGNHRLDHLNSLYHFRREVVEWYEGNASTLKFSFWGAGWDGEVLGICNRYTKRLARYFPFFARKFKNHKGFASDKISILKESKFCFSIENAKNYDGYITEKIFDCFWARTIPIYAGPPNISKFIPENCYINFNKFKTIQELDNYLVAMGSDDYFDKIREIEKFLNSPEASMFSNKTCASLVLAKVIDKLGKK